MKKSLKTAAIIFVCAFVMIVGVEAQAADDATQKVREDLAYSIGVLYIQENIYNKDRVLKVDPYAAIAKKNLKIMGTIDSRRIDRSGIIRVLRNQEVQRMWDVVVTHEFPISEAEEALKVSVTKQCGKIMLYPHGLPTA